MRLRAVIKLLLPVAVMLLSYACTTTVPAPVSNKSAKQTRSDVTTTGRSTADVKKAVDKANNKADNKGVYVVKQDDTLYSIAWRYKHDYRDMAAWNNIKKPYTIFPGQKLRLQAPTAAKPRQSLQPGPIVAEDSSTHTQPPGVKQKSTVKRTGIDSGKRSGKRTGIRTGIRSGKQPGAVITHTSKRKQQTVANIKWQWPSRAELAKRSANQSSKGVDFNGRQGDKIIAAAAGEVVYSGDGLLGYGKLVIIKHNDTFLSAYAYNKKILVNEGDKVNAGQAIATMGIGMKGLPTLHFEIRKDGKPTNPLHYLPRQKS